jgi:hypothetical protein
MSFIDSGDYESVFLHYLWIYPNYFTTPGITLRMRYAEVGVPPTSCGDHKHHSNDMSHPNVRIQDIFASRLLLFKTSNAYIEYRRFQESLGINEQN